jgi:hypothetical protein
MAAMTDQQKRQQKNQIALDRSRETSGTDRLKLLQQMRLESVTPPPALELADGGANLRGMLLDNILQQQAAAMPAINPAVGAVPGQQSDIDAAFNPLIKEAGSVSEPNVPIAESIFPALAQAVSVGFAKDPAAALQNQLLNQKIEAQNKQERKDKAKDSALNLKVQVAGKKLDVSQKAKDRLADQDDETRRYLTQFAGQEKLQNLKHTQEKELHEMSQREEAQKIRGNQSFQAALQEATQGDRREAERLSQLWDMVSVGIPYDKANAATKRIYFADKNGQATVADGALVTQAHKALQKEKEKLSGRLDKQDKLEQFLFSAFSTGVREYNDANAQKFDFAGRPANPAPNQTLAIANGVKVMNAANEYVKAAMQGKGGVVTPVSDGNNAPKATAEQKLKDVAVNDPDQVDRAKGAAAVDQMLASGQTVEAVQQLLAVQGIAPGVLAGALARLKEKGNGK